MCGICGFNWDDKTLLKRMADSIQHRGPDDVAYYSQKQISLGMRRLKIIDLRKRLYPITNAKGNLQLVFNGEIFNFKELREGLEKKGYRFKTDCDAEVIVHLYEEKGPACVEDLNGFFAIAIWDDKKKELFLARDRLGIKPLYYWHNGSNFAFASEIKSLLEFDEIPRTVDKNAFKQFITFRFAPGEQTIMKGIKRLKPGHSLVLKKGKTIIRKYWDLTEKIEDRPASYFSEKLLRLLTDSVDKRLMSDVPLGAYLSGGIDSTAIVGLMSKLQDNPVKTFTVGFGEGAENELGYARRVSEEYGTDHHEVMVEDKDLSRLPQMVWHMDEPIGDAATLPTFIISEFAKPRVTVTLAGEGSDEQFAGYKRYKLVLLGKRISGFSPAVLRTRVFPHIARNIPAHSNLRRAADMLTKKDVEEQFLHVISLFDDNEQTRVFPDRKPAPRLALFGNKDIKHTLNNLLYFDIKTLLPDDFFMKVDKMTMAHALEERVPFLDHRLVEFSMTIPPHFKLRRFNEKYILKRAVKSYVPREIIKRKKQGYNAPQDRWLKGPLNGFFDDLLDDAKHGLYDVQYVKSLLHRFRRSGTNYDANWYNSQKLWSMLMFEMWHNTFIKREKLKI